MEENLGKRSRESVNLIALLLIFILSFALVVYQLLTEVNSQIDFAQQEMNGSEYLRPLEALLADVPQSGLWAHRYFRQGISQESYLTQQDRIEQDLQKLIGVQQRLGQQLDTAQQVKSLQQTWQHLKEQLLEAETDSRRDSEIQSLYRDLTTQIRGLISRVGDHSNLILDPDLDSHYLMDVVLLKLSEGQDLLAQVRLLGEDIVKRQTLTSEQKGRLAVLAGLLQENLNATQKGMTVAFRHNPIALQPVLEGLLKTSVTATAEFLATLNQAIAQAKTVQVQPTAYDPVAYDRAATVALQTSFTLWEQTVNELDQLLMVRIQKLSYKTYFVEAFAIFVLAVIIGVFLLS